ncbi:MAG: hypothetical protein A2233_03750 [Candidatus Kerfeldbacteria bacterium RIFOXYA2_FULL_38_24]|uniref:Nucleotidyl transferase domain-containing protein n=1 Tax=Candidatus Kerfeldbacteria bacterium RIFOXYB2_FULL_38_14 TaxID=1798547 RepID=A0A1G2BA67_9BACT|nr:MAG: hypothetical protein A2233_03750 [Candidatus Kerfeldbacteria bacterium RIFOXYA2_FULL_38_24]OGY86108.1 MAG: hypothetical protein A2319_01395 [Candidatus Kerfeldbacteria bacterium RIFOXYB2_FULL_38_14]OGY89817.1 MAG: hypothetical protein A2458_05560 [Candidatus Kerfeldbacteria bacterium RIFOXYC2_FULL_38_9]
MNTLPNQAIILCGGLGTRLRPLTKTTPKPMVLIEDRPFLEHQINYLKTFGITNIVLATGYLHEKIEKHFGQQVQYSREEKKLGTAGALKNAEKLLNENFLVCNGDTFFKLNYQKFLQFHQTKNSACTLALKTVNNTQSAGFVQISPEQKIINFAEKNPQLQKGLISAGIYVMQKTILKLIPENQECSLEYEIFPKLLNQMYGFVDSGFFIDIGTFNNYHKFKKEFTSIFYD